MVSVYERDACILSIREMLVLRWFPYIRRVALHVLKAVLYIREYLYCLFWRETCRY